MSLTRVTCRDCGFRYDIDEGHLCRDLGRGEGDSELAAGVAGRREPGESPEKRPTAPKSTANAPSSLPTPTYWRARAQAMKQNLESRARATGADGSYLKRTPDSHGGVAFFTRRAFDELYLLICHLAREEPAEDYAAYLARAEPGYPHG